MFGPMFRELLGYSTGLIVMQRLESRHSLLKRFLAWRHKQYPATLSAALRRRENKDLEEPDFQSNLPELLASVGELDVGEWGCKTEFLEKVCGASAIALHDSLLEERKNKEVFHEELAIAAGHKQREANQEHDLPLIREHVKAALERNKCYALKGFDEPTKWTLFRVLTMNPGQNMYLQRACLLSIDDLWHSFIPGHFSQLQLQLKIFQSTHRQDFDS